jgi:hypothetical protein
MRVLTARGRRCLNASLQAAIGSDMGPVALGFLASLLVGLLTAVGSLLALGLGVLVAVGIIATFAALQRVRPY